MNASRPSLAQGWLLLIGLLPVLVLAATIGFLSRPMDPWAAGAVWGVTLVFFTLPGVLLPLVVGAVLYWRARGRGEQTTRFRWALLPGAVIALGGLLFLGSQAMRASHDESHLWQSRVLEVPEPERYAVHGYATVLDLAVAWQGTSGEVLDRRLARLAGNAEACLRQNAAAWQWHDRVHAWVLDDPNPEEHAQRQARWVNLISQYGTEYRAHQMACDATLNFKTAEERYPHG